MSMPEYPSAPPVQQQNDAMHALIREVRGIKIIMLWALIAPLVLGVLAIILSVATVSQIRP